MEVILQQVACGLCTRVNLVQIDPPIDGSHFCTKCRATICIVNGKSVELKNNSATLNTVRKSVR